MPLYGLDFLRSETETMSEREDRESGERMKTEFMYIEHIRKRQRNGENLILYRNYLGHLRVRGEEDPDVTFVNRNDDTVWFPEPYWKARLYEVVYENKYLGVHYA
jgi:hypothetical protein